MSHVQKLKVDETVKVVFQVVVVSRCFSGCLGVRNSRQCNEACRAGRLSFSLLCATDHCFHVIVDYTQQPRNKFEACKGLISEQVVQSAALRPAPFSDLFLQDAAGASFHLVSGSVDGGFKGRVLKHRRKISESSEQTPALLLSGLIEEVTAAQKHLSEKGHIALYCVELSEP